MLTFPAGRRQPRGAVSPQAHAQYGGTAHPLPRRPRETRARAPGRRTRGVARRAPRRLACRAVPCGPTHGAAGSVRPPLPLLSRAAAVRTCPRALLVNVGALDRRARGLDAKTDRLVVARLADATASVSAGASEPGSGERRWATVLLRRGAEWRAGRGPKPAVGAAAARDGDCARGGSNGVRGGTRTASWSQAHASCQRRCCPAAGRHVGSARRSHRGAEWRMSAAWVALRRRQRARRLSHGR